MNKNQQNTTPKPSSDFPNLELLAKAADHVLCNQDAKIENGNISDTLMATLNIMKFKPNEHAIMIDHHLTTPQAIASMSTMHPHKLLGYFRHEQIVHTVFIQLVMRLYALGHHFRTFAYQAIAEHNMTINQLTDEIMYTNVENHRYADSQDALTICHIIMAWGLCLIDHR